MKPTDFIPEKHAIGQAAVDMHGDHEIQMAREECYHAATNAMELHRMLKHVSEQEGLQAWASEKITLANDYLRTVKEWLEYEIMTKLQDSVMTHQVDADVLQAEAAVAEATDFKKRELEHELSDEDSGQYYVMIVKGGKWEYTKAQPKQKGMNAATDVVKNLHAKYPTMHLGIMGPDGKVHNLGKGKVKEDVSAGGMSSGAMATGAAGSLFGGKVVKRKSK
jgi:ribosomal protein S6